MKLISKRNISFLLKTVGWLAILAGLVGLYYGPLEFYCFYMFTEDGQFGFENFTIGHLWFALLAVQNTLYYIVAFFLLPIGVGLIKLWEWSRKLILNALYLTMVLGISGAVSFTISIPYLIGEYNLISLIGISLLLVLGGIALPYVAVRILKSKKVLECFNETKTILSPVSPTMLLVGTISLFFLLFFHLSIFFKGIFPLFGTFIFQRPGVFLLSGAIFFLTILLYFYFKKTKVGYWGMIVYFSLLLLSVILTFGRYSTLEVIQLLDYSQFEMENIIALIPFLDGFNVLVMFSFVISITLGLVINSRKDFE